MHETYTLETTLETHRTGNQFATLLERVITLLDLDEQVSSSSVSAEEARLIIESNSHAYLVGITRGAGEQETGFHVDIEIEAHNGFDPEEARDLYNSIKSAVSDVFPKTREL